MARINTAKTFLSLVSFTALCAAGLSNPARADCTGPPGVEGDMTYASNYKTMVFCNGSQWIDMAAGGGSAGSGGGVVNAPNCEQGEQPYWDTSANGLKCPEDTTPASFDFADQAGVAQGVVVESNTVTISGIDVPTSVSVSGDGGPEIRIDGGSWVTSGTINNGESLQSRMTTNADIAVTNTATVTVGSDSDDWSTVGDPCQSSPSVGDVCADGTIYAGLGNMYITDQNQSGGAGWYAADFICNSLNRHGYSDWSLPSQNQLNTLCQNQNAIGDFTSDPYWSSELQGNQSAYGRVFSDCSVTSPNRDNTFDVRCVRTE